MLQLDPSAKTELLPSRALCYKVLALSRSRSMRKLIVAVILLFASICPMQAQTLDEIVSKHLDAMGWRWKVESCSNYEHGACRRRPF
jgi:hypothetical protein